MNNKEEKKEKKKKSFLDNVIGLMITTYFIIFLAGMIGSPLYYIDYTKYPDWVETIIMYIPFIFYWLVWYLWCKKKGNEPILKVATKLKGNTVYYLVLGLFLGFLMNATCMLIAYFNGDLTFEFSRFNLIYVLLIFITVFIQSSAEEILCRGFLFYRLDKSYHKPLVSILISSLFFSLLHVGNPNVTLLSLFDIFLCGVLYAMMVYYMDSIWCAFAHHAAWNFTQNIIFGLPNSGQTVPYSIFTLLSAKNSTFYDIGFGIEGSLISIIINLIAILILYLWGKKHKEKHKLDIWKEEKLELEK